VESEGVCRAPPAATPQDLFGCNYLLHARCKVGVGKADRPALPVVLEVGYTPSGGALAYGRPLHGLVRARPRRPATTIRVTAVAAAASPVRLRLRLRGRPRLRLCLRLRRVRVRGDGQLAVAAARVAAVGAASVLDKPPAARAAPPARPSRRRHRRPCRRRPRHSRSGAQPPRRHGRPRQRAATAAVARRGAVGGDAPPPCRRRGGAGATPRGQGATRSAATAEPDAAPSRPDRPGARRRAAVVAWYSAAGTAPSAFWRPTPAAPAWGGRAPSAWREKRKKQNASRATHAVVCASASATVGRVGCSSGTPAPRSRRPRRPAGGPSTAALLGEVWVDLQAVDGRLARRVQVQGAKTLCGDRGQGGQPNTPGGIRWGRGGTRGAAQRRAR